MIYLFCIIRIVHNILQEPKGKDQKGRNKNKNEFCLLLTPRLMW